MLLYPFNFSPEQVSGKMAGGALRLPHVQQTNSGPPPPQHRDPSAGWTGVTEGPLQPGVACPPRPGPSSWYHLATSRNMDPVLLLKNQRRNTDMITVNWGNLVTTQIKTEGCCCLATVSKMATRHLVVSERLSPATHTSLHHSSFNIPPPHTSLTSALVTSSQVNDTATSECWRMAARGRWHWSHSMSECWMSWWLLTWNNYRRMLLNLSLNYFSKDVFKQSYREK